MADDVAKSAISLQQEIRDLRALLNGLPPEIRGGGAFSAYELRLEILRQQAAEQSYLTTAARLRKVLHNVTLMLPVLLLATGLSLAASFFPWSGKSISRLDWLFTLVATLASIFLIYLEYRINSTLNLLVQEERTDWAELQELDQKQLPRSIFRK